MARTRQAVRPWVVKTIAAAALTLPPPAYAQIAGSTAAGPPAANTGGQTGPGDQEAPGGTKVDASRGGITISSGVNSLTIGARAQVRWTLDDREAFDADIAGSGAGEPDGPFSQFDIARLRVTLSGGVYKPWLRYSFQFEAGRTSGEGSSKIKDALVEFRPVGRNYRISAGQFKVPFGLQQLTSSGRLQFADRAITDSKFNPSRDMGAMVSGTAANRKLGYDVGLFNGSGESVRQNNRSHLWAARVAFAPLGPYALSESAVDAPEKGVVHFGLGVRGGKQIRGRTTAAIVDEADNQTAWNLEFAYKRPRIYTTAEYFRATDEQANPTSRPDLHSAGFHLQGGYMLVPERIEIALLWARIEGDTDVDDAEVSELRSGINYFWVAHNLKLQADIGEVAYGSQFASLSARARQGLPVPGPRLVTGDALSDLQVRVQFQLGF